ncbi:MAG: NGG1p interacting factor NIF3 [Spirochaetaceae bacterium]
MQYKIIVYVPEAQAEQVKEALFGAGAGGYELYDNCAWQTKGTGQFRPREGSNPFLGTVGEVERVPELRVEVLCGSDHIRGALEALLEAHPYEEPAYEVVEVRQIGDFR